MSACLTPDWLEKSDEAFAADCADLAFEGSLEQRELLAWLFFVRINQLIADLGGVSDTGRVPVWMAWPTDDDTFACEPSFEFTLTNRDDIVPVTEKKVLAGEVALHEPDGANEEVTRNQLGYDYVTSAGLNNQQGQYYGTDPNKGNFYLGEGLVPLDFMWPIPFQAVKSCS